jgi:hypothetical protein
VLLAGFAPEFHQAHVVGRTDGRANRFRQRLARRLAQKTRRPRRDGQQIRPAGDPMMHACRGKKMPKIVELEIQRVLKRRGRGAGRPLTVGASFFPKQNARLEATVRALRPADDLNGFLYPTLHSRVARAGERGRSRFEPFVEIPIVEGRSTAVALGQAGRDAEILEELGMVGSIHNGPERGNRVGAANFLALSPKAAGPARVRQRHLLQGRDRIRLSPQNQLVREPEIGQRPDEGRGETERFRVLKLVHSATR